MNETSKHTVHEVLLEHDWEYDTETRMYSIDFLAFPASVPQAGALIAHNSMRDYFQFDENRNLKS